MKKRVRGTGGVLADSNHRHEACNASSKTMKARLLALCALLAMAYAEPEWMAAF